MTATTQILLLNRMLKGSLNKKRMPESVNKAGEKGSSPNQNVAPVFNLHIRGDGLREITHQAEDLSENEKNLRCAYDKAGFNIYGDTSVETMKADFRQSFHDMSLMEPILRNFLIKAESGGDLTNSIVNYVCLGDLDKRQEYLESYMTHEGLNPAQLKQKEFMTELFNLVHGEKNSYGKRIPQEGNFDYGISAVQLGNPQHSLFLNLKNLICQHCQ